MEQKPDKIETLRSNETPIYKLTPLEQEKWRKLGTLRYSHCAQTLRRIYHYDSAVFDSELDLVFESQNARSDYYREKGLGKPKVERFNKKSKYKKQQFRKAA